MWTRGWLRDSATGALVLAATPCVGPVPDDNNLLTWGYDPNIGSGGTAFTAGVVHLCRQRPAKAITVGKVGVWVYAAGTGGGQANSFVGVYDQAGNRRGVSADQSATWGSNGYTQATLTPDAGGLSFNADEWFWTAFLVGTHQVTTPMQMIRPNHSSAFVGNINSTNSTMRHGTILTGQTSLPASIVPGNIAQAQAYWMGTAA